MLILVVSVCLSFSGGWAAPPKPAQSESDAVVHHLNALITWYRHVITLNVEAGQPGDLLYLENARRLAAQAVQFAFQSASAQAALLAGGNGNSNSETPTAQQQSLANSAANIDKQITLLQAQLQAIETEIKRATGKKRDQLVAQRDALQGELGLYKEAQDSLRQIAGLGNPNETSGGELATQINQLKQSVPEVFGAGLGQKTTAVPTASAVAPQTAAKNSGLISETSALFTQLQAIHQIDQAIAGTVRLREGAQKLAMPLRASLRGLIQQGKQLANQPPPASNAAPVATTQQTFSELTAEFKKEAAAAVPLSQEIVVLDQCHSELVDWRDSIALEYGRALRRLLLRVAAVLIALAFVFFLSRLWHRATLRYIHDARRRRQLSVIRRVVIGFMMVVVIVVGFISEFTSLATFAGLITAGIAVALQSVILSIAAYFFLVGRYGVRVGDRVTVSGVTGDVIEIGLVRLYLMELSGTGIDLYPTGRVVVFSNAVMFQTAPFFKQLPGTAYAWHEIAVNVAPQADLAALERKLMDVVNSVYSQYRQTIDHQHALVERLLDTSMPEPVPIGKVQFTDKGPEFVVRYPVVIHKAADIDDELTRKLLQAIEQDAELKAAVSASPQLRAAIKA